MSRTTKVKVNEMKVSATQYEVTHKYIEDGYEQTDIEYMVEIKVSPVVLHVGRKPVEEKDLINIIGDVVKDHIDATR